MPYNSFLEVNGVQTHVACWGRWVEENEPDEVIILIPGNPGLVGFYFPYLEKLHQLTNLPVWTIGHAGHEEPNPATAVAQIGPIQGNEEKFDLNGQYVHKLNFIKQYTKPSTKIHFIGHSIGAWITMELMKDEGIRNQVVTNNLLFPTVQKMVDTPNGFLLTQVLRRITMIIWLLLWFFNILPFFIQTIIIRIFYLFQGIPALDIFSETIRKYLCSSVIEKVLFMAYDEMNKVTQLDTANFENNIGKVKIVYGIKDGWAPAKYFIEMKRNIPNLYMKNVPFAHAFCISAFKEMAVITSDLITEGN